MYTQKEIFETQIEALLVAADRCGKVNVMLPMVTVESDITDYFTMVEEVKERMFKEGKITSDNINWGIMIETPAAALISDDLAPLVDFFSIGTNDLIQYTLACNRQNPHLEKYADPHHKAVLSLIKTAVENGHKHGIWVGICGELASDTSLTEEFLKMGVDELSVSPSFVLPVRKRIREIDLSK
jgi:phosphotransferase system enzyme I (PtsI)